MRDTATQIRISVLGPLRVEAADGSCLTPKGAKNQALLALLALSPEMSRTRRWLEDKLWSQFGPEQASANLRQALSKLRSALGPHAGILVADRSTVALAQTGIAVDLRDEGLPFDQRSELLEGLDARDPEFEEWLRMERADLQARLSQAEPKLAKGVLIHCRSAAPAEDGANIMADILANQIGENIAEQIRAWRQANDPDHPAELPMSDISLTCDILKTSDGHTLFVKGLHVPSGRILYSKMQAVSQLEAILRSDEIVAKLVFEAADCIIGKLPQVLDTNRPESRATALSRLSMYRMFSFERDALREAHSLLKQAYELDPNGIYLAWSSMVRMIQLLELLEEDRDALREEAIALNYRAMEASEDNALVHALISKVRGTAQRDAAGAFELADTAVNRNPASAFAWKSLAEANMLKGDVASAFDASARARAIARSSPFKQWWDMGHCIIAIACNRPQEAIEAGEAAARAAPLSRPAHRHLLALYALDGQLDKAQATAVKLGKIEPGFSIDQIINDENYPVRTLRNKGLLEPIRALL
ncbi:transcriptional regulator [Salipiger bermudensis]|uniref:AfsR/SARP family transcriptional regulator n=1 Tax=Salipiger bermudensis TaxID=344736 RepID=UPI001C99A49C|nr:transcriptional regulator [Salipiger bermudensis]MBY6004848.1 transcriptional regulator [Salipiger bermudensis]